MNSTTIRLAMAAVLGVGALAACRDGTGSQGRTPAHVVVTAGDAQTGAAGAALAAPVAAQVTDAHGRPVSGQVVSFTVLSGGGSVGASTVTTDAQGLARTTWTLGGAAGEQTLEARLVPAAGTGPAPADTARATATPAAPASIVVVGSATRTDTAGRTVADSLTVRVRDGYGNPVPGAAVTFTPAGGGTVSPATAVTRADGTARAAWTLGTTPGAQTVSASTTGGDPVAFTATALPRNRLQLVTHVPGVIQDIDATRVLWVDSVLTAQDPSVLHLRTLPGGADQTVVNVPGGSVASGLLTPFGVVYELRSRSSHGGSVYDWRGGSPTLIGSFNPEGTLRAEGSYALWLENATLRLRDLAANTTTDVATDARAGANLTAAGVVAYSTAGTPNAVRLWSGGGTTPVATMTGSDAALNPRTDGTNVVYLVQNVNMSTLTETVVLRTPSVTQALTSDVGVPLSYLEYLVVSGWIAWGDPPGVYRRTAAGPAQQLATHRSTPEALAPDGTLLFRTLDPVLGWMQYLAPPGAAAQVLGAGTDTDRGELLGGTAYVISGGSLYRVVP